MAIPPVKSRTLGLVLFFLTVSMVLGLGPTAAAVATHTNASVLANSTASSGSGSGSSGGDNETVAVNSRCALCRDQAQCSQAYNGGPGVYCNSLSASVACCCAAESMCVRSPSPHACKCVSRHALEPGTFSSQKILWTCLLFVLLLCLLIAMYVYTTRLDRSYHYRESHAVRVTLPPVPAGKRTQPSVRVVVK